jgi:hypothetical protein
MKNSLWPLLLLACSDGLAPSPADLGLGPVAINPLETVVGLQNHPKCELPSTESVSSVQAVSIASTRVTAEEGFGSVSAVFEEVRHPMPDVRACRPTPYSQTLSPSAATPITDVLGGGYRHLSMLTFVPDRSPSASSQARGDLFVHGSGREPLYLVLRDIDFRKFLYQDIVLHDCTTHPERCDTERTSSPEKHPFDSNVFQCIRNVHGYFAEFNRITKKLAERSSTEAPTGRLFHLTNNCREPGNYELALVSSKGDKQWGGHISLDIAFYSEILKELQVDHQALGTGLRVVGTTRDADGGVVYEVVAQKRFPSGCHIRNLAPFIGKNQRVIGGGTVAVVQETGQIPWDQFAGETQAKSGRRQDEAIVYVAVEGPPPSGFSDHGFHFQIGPDGAVERHNHEATSLDWAALSLKARAGAVFAPHTYATFADVAEYPFQLSTFEVDGRYLGRLKTQRIRGKAARMVGFDYRFLQGLKTAEVRVAVEADGRLADEAPRLEFRLFNEGCSRDGPCVNVVVGNLQLKPGQGTQFVLGIGTQPLRDLYVNDVIQGAQQYALTYDEAGNITDLAGHHGLGMIYVRRGLGDLSNEFVIDLVSYERAVPVWRGRLTVPSL